MTAQCAANRRRAAPGAVRAVPGYSAEVAFSTVYGRAGAVRARAGAGQVLPVDREFLATGVAGRPGSRRTRRPAPCPNCPRVSAALREFAAGRRGDVSRMRVPGGRGREAPHAMVTRRRKRREGRGPEDMHMGFATNMPSADPDAPCPRGRGIEIGYKMPRQTRMRAPGRDESARIFYLVVSLMVHNARAVMHPGRRAAGDGRGIPATAPRIMIVPGACEGPGIRPPHKPPP